MSFSPTPQRQSSSRAAAPFHEHAGIDIIDAPVGFGETRISDRRELQNHLGTVHGGVLFALGEVAAASAMHRLLGSDLLHLRAITRSGAIEYLKPARGAISGVAIVGMSAADIVASLERAPSILVPIAVELKQPDGAVVARLSIAWFVGLPKA